MPFTAFGLALNTVLKERRVSKKRLSWMMQLAPCYGSFLCRGRRRPTPELIDRIASTLNLTDAEALALHHAAIRQLGYRLT